MKKGRVKKDDLDWIDQLKKNARAQLDELANIPEADEETMAALRKLESGISTCCDAPLEDAGAGWRRCTKCKENVFHACGRAPQ